MMDIENKGRITEQTQVSEKKALLMMLAAAAYTIIVLAVMEAL